MNEESSIINNISGDLKIQLDILAKENHTTIENLIIDILNKHVQNKFSDCDDITIE